jgi:hypothetical protein
MEIGSRWRHLVSTLFDSTIQAWFFVSSCCSRVWATVCEFLTDFVIFEISTASGLVTRGAMADQK